MVSKIAILGSKISTIKKKKLHKEPTVFTKINSKWITDLYVNLKTIKLLEDNIRGMIETASRFGDEFLDIILKA